MSKRSNDRDPRKARAKVKAKAAQKQEFYFEEPATVLMLLVAGVIMLHLFGGALGHPYAARPGDRLFFTQNALVRTTPAVVIPATRTAPDRKPVACLLNSSVMGTGTGTLTVAEAGPERIAMLWAGGGTAQGAKNCAGPGQIAVSAKDYERLARAQLVRPHTMMK